VKQDIAFQELLSEAVAQKDHEILAIRMAHEQRVGELERELAEMKASFDLRWKADMRAIKKWQAETGRTMEWPDHADLCVWLMGKLETLSKEA
jgi:aspartyl/asparaginyl beta-hydroxylase (cupin superfamily)